MAKNVLVIAGNSGIGAATANLLNKNGCNVYVTSRKPLNDLSSCTKNLILDVRIEDSFRELKEALSDVKLDAVVYIAGVAIASPVEFLEEEQLRHQYDVVIFGLLRTIKYFAPLLNKDGRIINMSSMASYGSFPFLSPYCSAKRASDIMLNSYAIETGVKVVSIKPGVIKTPFWNASIQLNDQNLVNVDEKYKKEAQFLLKNATKNGNEGLDPVEVAKAVSKAVFAKNPKSVYTVGEDAFMASLSKFIPQGIMNGMMRKVFYKKINSM